MSIHINSAWDAECFYREREEARRRIQSSWDAQKFYETYGGNGHAGNWNAPKFNYNAKAIQANANLTYNPITRNWDISSLTGSSINTSTISSGTNGTVSQSAASTGGNTSSKKDAEKDYIDIEFNTLTGDVKLIPTTENLKIKAGTTVRLVGVGKYLSGTYFVAEVKKSITNSDGISISAKLYKNGFGETMKSDYVGDVGGNQIDISKNVVSNHIKVGDKVRVIGDAKYYSQYDNGVPVPEWVKTKMFIVKEVSEDGTRAKLDLVWNWVFTQYLKVE